MFKKIVKGLCILLICFFALYSAGLALDWEWAWQIKWVYISLVI